MAEVDLSVGGLEIFAGIKTELGRLNAHNEAERIHRARERSRARVPAQVRFFNSVIIPTPTVRTGIAIDGPPAGYFWLLRRLIIGGTTFKTTAAGTAEVYVTGLGGSAGQAVVGPIITGLALTDLVGQAPTLPNIAYYTSQQIVLQNNENLMVVIDTGTALQQYTAAAQFEVWRTISDEAGPDLA